MTSVKTRSLTTVKTLPAPRNGWYAAAWDREVTRTPASVRVAGQPLVFYRTEDGRPVALADACWHPLAPLSMGTLVGSEEIRCPYHGIVYDSAGRCTAMPAQEVLIDTELIVS
jgi:phenylpropionate dioxygenase-like ring-hydroxylating dioxygenase large terminal subunit